MNPTPPPDPQPPLPRQPFGSGSNSNRDNCVISDNEGYVTYKGSVTYNPVSLPAPTQASNKHTLSDPHPGSRFTDLERLDLLQAFTEGLRLAVESSYSSEYERGARQVEDDIKRKLMQILAA